MKLSNEQLIKIEENAKKNKKKLTLISDKTNLTADDRFKMGLCKQFVRFTVINKMKLKDVASLTGVPITRMSEITNYKISKFSVDQLLRNLSALSEHDAQIRAYIELLESVAEMPAPKVATSKRLSKGIKEASVQL